ncbi:MAG: ApeA N-terminal domain 1-containing protein [Candidatus Humimicrobiaceae bacterium]
MIRNFLILGIAKPIYPSVVRANINKRKKVVIYRAININMGLLDLSFSNMLFTLNDIEKDIEKYLRNWFIKSNRLKNDWYF